MDVHKGIIKGFSGSWLSGMGFLSIEDSVTGGIEYVPCDNAPTVRALEACFGNVIGEAHCVAENPGFMDKEVYWSYDEMGFVLGGFTPVDQATPELLEFYENQEE